MSNKPHFHITITENSTGRILYNEDTNCITGAYYSEEQGGVAAFNAADCNAKTLIETLCGCYNVADQTIETTPKLVKLSPLIKLCREQQRMTGIDMSALLSKDE